ncbi:hypothetical protein MNEG_10515 [Monoraphidium neglectum]|uniref:Uncharacterized protein n=1 Tax=Monoraphidium neglectum TaxID=145388 RepID=A0A0D2JCP6_9CHLO|nr:hypothetical protein MNEG_10515 [Monoraphidium neglectum]KIY97447.1 hypothetical protein MNEG_10515 [Monoraphidium neglectum]|eukprot:XP_013896467.1 hypothetical protein MNEG_10515 [Monoraphidium neglectum]
MLLRGAAALLEAAARTSKDTRVRDDGERGADAPTRGAEPAYKAPFGCPDKPIYYVECSLDAGGNVIGLSYGPKSFNLTGKIGNTSPPVTEAAVIAAARKKPRVRAREGGPKEAAVATTRLVGPLEGGLQQVISTPNANGTAAWVTFFAFETPKQPQSCGSGVAAPAGRAAALSWGRKQWKKGTMVLSGFRGTPMSLESPCWMEWGGSGLPPGSAESNAGPKAPPEVVQPAPPVPSSPLVRPPVTETSPASPPPASTTPVPPPLSPRAPPVVQPPAAREQCPEEQRALAILKSSAPKKLKFSELKPMAEVSQAASTRSLTTRVAARIAVTRLRARKASAAALAAKRLAGPAPPAAEKAVMPSASKPAAFESAPIVSDNIVRAGMLAAAGAPAGRAPGASALASETLLDGVSSDGFWGVGYGQNGGYNPLNLALAVASVDYGGQKIVTVMQASAQAAGVYDAAGGSVVDPVALSSLFAGVLPPGAPAGDSVVDFPTLQFDAAARRWVMAAAYSDWNWDTSRPGQPLLAASMTDDPAGDWKVFALPDPGGIPGITACNADTHYPVIYNAQSTLDGYGVYVTGEVLCSALDSATDKDGFAGAFIYAVPKAALYDAQSAAPLPVAVYSDLQVAASAESLGGGQAQWVQLQPARPQTAADAAAARALFVSQNGEESGDYNTMAVIKLTDTNLLTSMTDDVTKSPRLRARAFQKGFQFSRPKDSLQIQQPGSSVPIELEVAGAFRVSSAAVSNGDLYFAKPELNSPPNVANPDKQPDIPSIFWAQVRAAGNLCDRSSSSPGAAAAAAGGGPQGDVAVAASGVVSATSPAASAMALGSPAVAVDPAGRVHLAYACGSPAPAAAPMYAGVCVSVAGTTGVPKQRVLRVMAGDGAVEDPYNEGLVAWGLYSSAQFFDGELWYAVSAAQAPSGSSDAGLSQPGAWVGAYDAVFGSSAAAGAPGGKRAGAAPVVRPGAGRRLLA